MEVVGTVDIDVSPKSERMGNSRINLSRNYVWIGEVGAIFQAFVRAEPLGSERDRRAGREAD